MDAFDFLNFLKRINLYYRIKPFIPRWIQIVLRRFILHQKKDHYQQVWPINEDAAKLPDGWNGWPEQKTFALVLTHDVEGNVGQEKCKQLADLEKELGFRSIFNFVPRRYNVSPEVRKYLKENGFEVGVHGLTHDGKLYASRKIFKQRAVEINKYIKEWGAVGFRAPSMHHNLEWNCALNIEYDMSTFDTDPFEPQSDGINTIFPIKIDNCNDDTICDIGCRGYIELPYTLPQDFALFIILKEVDIGIWEKKLDWIVKKGGMALLNTHPDYMNFENRPCKMDEYPFEYYKKFLELVKDRYKNKYWHVLPREIARFWKNNYTDSCL